MLQEDNIKNTFQKFFGKALLIRGSVGNSTNVIIIS